MRENRTFCLLMLVAAFLPLHPNFAFAQGRYATFALSSAQDRALTSAAYTGCLNRAGGVTANINDCIGTESSRLDRRLNASYQAALRRLPPARQRALRSEERGWLATRDEVCLAKLETPGEIQGTLDQIQLNSCSLEELKRRIVWIERWR
jgi:uncharacterized protein YecT (DUF1311 family)